MSGVIFADGDEWRDLSEDVRRAGRVTVVTRRGTAVLLDLVGQDPRYLRLPLEGGHQMTLFDCGWLPIDGAEVVATPCGLVLDHARFWYRSTRVRLVLEGLHPRWLVDSPHGRAVLEAVMAGTAPYSPNHVVEPCAAYYCVRKIPA